MGTSGENDKFVTLIASLEGMEPIRRRVRKDVIQSESLFLKEYIEEGATEIKIPLRRPKNLNCILKYLHEEKLTVSKENNLESLWNDARILGLVNLEKVCIQRLTDTISLDSWIQRLEFSQAEGCHELETNVLSFINANFENCSSSSSYKSLRADQMVQVLQLPNVKSAVTESNRIALILDWIKAKENDRCPQAHLLIDQVDLTKLTEDALRMFLDKESAFRNWRCVAILERAFRLKKLEDTARNSDTTRGGLDQCGLSAAHPVMSRTVEGTRKIKQEVVSVESSDAEDLEVKESQQNVSTKNTEDSARECALRMKRERSPPPSSSVCEAKETNDKTDEDSTRPKMPKLEYSQADPVATYQPRASNQKQVLYLTRSSEHGYNLNFVILDGDSVSQAERVQVDLPPYYKNKAPKLIWSEEARGLFFLGEVNHGGSVLNTVRYMNGQRPLNVTRGPSMLVSRHRFQPTTFNGGLYAIGGSQCIRFKNRRRHSRGEVLDMTADSSGWIWQPIEHAPMKCDLYTAAVAEGSIYIIGGLRDTAEERNDSKPVATNEVMCYDPTSSQWEFVRRMGFPRCGHASAIVGRRIYVFGGCNLKYEKPHEDLSNMRTAEVYNIEENKWSAIAPMKRPRFGGSAVEMDGKIYVFGGDYNYRGKIPASVECYDPVSDSWTYVSTSIDSQGVFESIAVIDNPEHFL